MSDRVGLPGSAWRLARQRPESGCGMDEILQVAQARQLQDFDVSDCLVGLPRLVSRQHVVPSFRSASTTCRGKFSSA